MDKDGSEFLEELRRVLDYNPDTGEMTWKVATGRRVRVGSLAGTVNPKGRLQVRFKNKGYFAHRLAWLLTYGKLPDKLVDHIDGNPLNNRISNLRDVSNSVNQQNQRKATSRNKVGLLGVCPRGQNRKFQAQITINGEDKYLGTFLTEEEAHTAYLTAKRELHEGCAI